MKEEEKQRLALELFQQEQARLTNTSAISADIQLRLKAVMQHMNRQQKIKDSLGQNGISWQELKDAYDEAFNLGHTAMLKHHLSYFYAGAAIAYHEIYNADPESTAEFISHVADIPEENNDRATIIQMAREAVCLDMTTYDDNGQPSNLRAMLTKGDHVSRRKRNEINRMRQCGITEDDLEIERQLGYNNGWHTGFCFSICYAAVAIVLHDKHNATSVEVEEFIDRLEELRYEEITSVDIIERAKDEAGVDIIELIGE